MTVAIVGLPAGLTLPEELKQLKQHADLRNDGKDPHQDLVHGSVKATNSSA